MRFGSCVYKTCLISQVGQEDRTPADFRERHGAAEEAAQCDSGQSFTADTEPRNCTEEREARHSGGEVDGEPRIKRSFLFSLLWL